MLIERRVISSYSPDLMESMTEVTQYRYSFTVDKTSVLEASGHIDCEHRGLAGTADKAIMVAMIINVNGADVKGSKTGCNIVGVEDHYAVMPVHLSTTIPAGDYTVKVYARSASTAAAGVDGLAQIKATYNQVVFKVYDR